MATNTTTTISALAESRIHLKAQIDGLLKQLENLDASVIEEMEKEGLTKVETPSGKVSLVQSNTVVWNDEVLKELLTPAQWKRIRVEKVDKTRLEAELTIGRISEDDVAVARSVKQSKKFLR